MFLITIIVGKLGEQRLFLISASHCPWYVHPLLSTGQASLKVVTIPEIVCPTSRCPVPLKAVVWHPPANTHYRRKSMEVERGWLQKRRKQRKTILTLETMGNLRTLLHSLATCTHHVHRADGYGGAPRGANWKKTHRGSEKEPAARTTSQRNLQRPKPTRWLCISFPHEFHH